MNAAIGYLSYPNVPHYRHEHAHVLREREINGFFKAVVPLPPDILADYPDPDPPFEAGVRAAMAWG